MLGGVLVALIVSVSTSLLPEKSSTLPSKQSEEVLQPKAPLPEIPASIQDAFGDCEISAARFGFEKLGTENAGGLLGITWAYSFRGTVEGSTISMSGKVRSFGLTAETAERDALQDVKNKIKSNEEIREICD